jgi:hypothetical protein
MGRRRTESQIQLFLIIDQDSFNIFHLKPGLLFSLLSVFCPNCKLIGILFYDYIFFAERALRRLKTWCRATMIEDPVCVGDASRPL